MQGSYNLALVALSYVIALAASYTALELSRRVSHSQGIRVTIWLIAGSVSMGVGIWTMHFVGMLAFSLPMQFTYDVLITVLSLLVGIGTAGFAIFIASRKSNGYPKIAASGVLLGAGIASMHYTGMAAMKMDAAIVYDMKIVAASVAIAIAAAAAAIWIMFTLVDKSSDHIGKLKFGAAMIMGIAICGMHYTGMAAASYVPIGATGTVADAAENTWLAVTMGVAALLILGFTHLIIFFERRLSLEQAHSQKAAQEAVHLSEILDESSNEIFFFDSESHRFVRVNRGALANLGYTSEEMKTMTPLDIAPNFTVAKFNEMLRPLRTGEKNELLFETTHKRKDGTEYKAQVHLQMSTITEPPLFVAIDTDITEQKSLELRLAQSKKMESIGQLAAGIAHEINTPAQFVGDNTRFVKDAFSDLLELTSAYGRFAEAAKAGAITPGLVEEIDAAEKSADVEYLAEEIPSAIDQTLEGISRISNIVRAMKEFSHPGGEGRDSMDINNAIMNTMTVASNEWKYVATIETDFEPSLPSVSCFQQEVNQVFLNLIVNAAHAIESGQNGESGNKGVITITTRQVDDDVEISVSDTGCGVPEEIRDRVFDPFFTTKEVGKGTGQGLSMAYSTIVDKHGGYLTLDSIPGQGTTFTIRLPISISNSLRDEEAA